MGGRRRGLSGSGPRRRRCSPTCLPPSSAESVGDRDLPASSASSPRSSWFGGFACRSGGCSFRPWPRASSSCNPDVLVIGAPAQLESRRVAGRGLEGLRGHRVGAPGRRGWPSAVSAVVSALALPHVADVPAAPRRDHGRPFDPSVRRTSAWRLSAIASRRSLPCWSCADAGRRGWSSPALWPFTQLHYSSHRHASRRAGAQVLAFLLCFADPDVPGIRGDRRGRSGSVLKRWLASLSRAPTRASARLRERIPAGPAKTSPSASA